MHVVEVVPVLGIHVLLLEIGRMMMIKFGGINMDILVTVVVVLLGLGTQILLSQMIL